jgi:hypothetical protein
VERYHQGGLTGYIDYWFDCVYNILNEPIILYSGGTMQEKFSRAQYKSPIILDRKKIIDVMRRVELTDYCWNWLGWLDRGGYGYVGYKNKDINIHRFFYAWICGEIPEGKIIRHTCNNRRCVNPEHFLLGTMWDNSQDMINAGRSMTGIRNAQAVLNENKILYAVELYKNGASLLQAAQQVGVKSTTLHSVLTRKTWKHIKFELDYKEIVKDHQARKEKVPSKETVQMYKMWQNGQGWRQIGRQYKISDNAVKKRVLKYHRKIVK